MNRPTAPLVLGGTGKTGRRVAALLRRHGITPTIATRTPDGPDQRRFDWEDDSTWAPALHGADAVYLCFAPDLAVPGAAETVGAFTDLATRSGVQRVVLLSGRGEPDAERAERAVAAAAREWAVVRAAWFAQDFSEQFFLDGVLAGELALPVGDVHEPFVDADDVAEVAVAALLGETESGRVYEVTGPELLTFAEAIATIATVTGRQIRFTPVEPADLTAGLRAAGVSDEAVDLVAYLFAEVLDGRNAHTADGVQHALGRPARSFTEVAREAAGTGVWDSHTIAVGTER